MIKKFMDLNDLSTPDNIELLKELIALLSEKTKLDLILNINKETEEQKFEIINKESNTILIWIDSKAYSIENEDDMPCIEFASEDQYQDLIAEMSDIIESLDLYNEVI